jgi:hypothetical protein
MEMQKQRLAAWDEVDDFLTSSPSLQQILDYRPSEEAQARVRELLQMNRDGSLSEDDTAELDDYLALENFMRHLKIKALSKLQK